MPTRPRPGPHTSLVGALLGLALASSSAHAAPTAATPADTAPESPAATDPEPAQPAQPAQPEVSPVAPAEIMAPSVTAPLEDEVSGPPRPPVDPIDQVESEEDAEQAVHFFHSLYRPESNPGRLNTVFRTSYTVLGSNDHHLSGRFFGLSADIGQSWNTMGYALSLHANLGDLALRDDGKIRAVALLGAGPSVNLGRLALLQRGFLDLRVGYDFYYAPARSLDPDIAVAQSLMPHGPRLQLNMGLMVSPKRQRRFFHGVGATVGYQALVGAFSGDLPFTSMLSFGLSHWMG